MRGGHLVQDSFRCPCVMNHIRRLRLDRETDSCLLCHSKCELQLRAEILPRLVAVILRMELPHVVRVSRTGAKTYNGCSHLACRAHNVLKPDSGCLSHL